ncbi:MAG: glycoside hydrolase family 95 protein [Clostridia bacterium]|nr:glycoside hydrolase family 95 protein [Clostridia bacterium]
MSSVIFHDKYTRDWMRAFPLGNGRIGAMLYGDPHKETIEINEESLWSGKQLKESYVSDTQNLENIRDLLFKEKYEEASALCTDTLLASPSRVRFYESFGEIFIDFADKSDYTDYRKELDLNKAIATVSYTKNGVKYASEAFVSEKYDCFIYKLKAENGVFSCRVTMERGQDAVTSVIDGSTLLLDGQIFCPAHEYYGEEFWGMKFGARLHILSNGKTAKNKTGITVSDATELIIYAAFSTTYDIEKFDFDNSIDYQKRNTDTVCKVLDADYNEIREAHIIRHKQRFDKVCFELEADLFETVPTDERLRRVIEEDAEDLDLICLYYNFGRYLLSSCSDGNATLPANLQGIWCNGFRPPWGSDYHTNINLQMNYWCADNTNMSEAFLPFANYVKKLSLFGKETAQKLFGASGWVCNHTSDVFGRTGVHDSVQCGFFPMAGPWLCLNLWDHYEFTGDAEYLKDIFPVLKGSCEFLLDFLVEKDGVLHTAPSNSPENWFYYNDGGATKKSMFAYSAAMDGQIIRELFCKTAFACTLLGRERELAIALEAALTKLPPLRINEEYGTVCEWIKDYDEAEPGHRHISHLFGLYPGETINETDPEIFEAAKKTIKRRLSHGGGATGWSRAWIINFFARLKDGFSAGEHLKQLLKLSTAQNLFDMHPPFQIDGNFGAVAGITEMLIQSHEGGVGNRVVSLLPALPPKWKKGVVKGIRARGGFTFDIYWDNCEISKLRVTADNDSTLRIKLPSRRAVTSKPYTVSAGVAEMSFEKGESAEIVFGLA